MSTLLLVLFGDYMLPVLLVPRGMQGCCLLNRVYIHSFRSIIEASEKLKLWGPVLVKIILIIFTETELIKLFVQLIL